MVGFERNGLVRKLWYKMVRPCYLRLYPRLIFNLLGSGEEYETDLLKKELNPGDYFIDIGANVGYYSFIASERIGPSGKVFAFEPDPDNFRVLKENIAALGYKNIVPIQKAVANQSGKLKFYLSGRIKGDHRLYDSCDGRRFIEVETLKLDDYCSECAGRVKAIKIDIQGAEFSALMGMRVLLEKNPGLKIFTELWPVGLKNAGVEPAVYLQALSGLGYALYHINEHRRRLDLVDDQSQLLEKYTPQNRKYTNLYCSKDKPILPVTRDIK